MGIVFRSTPVPAVLTQPRGSETRGYARFTARLVEPPDNAFGREHPNSVLSLRRMRLAPDGSLRVRPPAFIEGPAEDAIPKGLMDALPDDGLLSVQWEFAPSREGLAGQSRG